MELKDKNGMQVVSDTEYQAFQQIKLIWRKFHSGYFAQGRDVAKITALFESMGKQEEKK